MDNLERQGHLGLIFPFPRSDSFRAEFEDLYQELLQFLEDYSRPTTVVTNLNGFCSLMEYFSELWQELGEELQADKNREVIVALVRFAMFASEPKKPSGIGSASKEKSTADHADPIKSAEQAESAINRLLIEIENNDWIPQQAEIAAYKASSAISNFLRVTKGAVTRSKMKTFRESAIFENLLEIFDGDAQRSIQLMNSVLNKMREYKIELGSNADGWKDRVRVFNKRYERN
jgi:hypothetical protein